MHTSTAPRNSEARLVQTTFVVQIFAYDGRLLSEYSLGGEDHELNSLAAAEALAVDNLSGFYREQVVLVVSEQTLTKLRQVQVNVVPPAVTNDIELTNLADLQG